MNTSNLKPDDFRALAIAESERLVAEAQQQLGRKLADPFEAGVSLCVLSGPQSAALQPKVRAITRNTLIIGIFGLLAGGAIALFLKLGARLDHIDDDVLLSIAVCFSVGGILTMLSGGEWAGRLVRKRISERIGGIPEDGPILPVLVGIENAVTYQTPKMVPEDHGIVLAYPDRQCIQIEGLLCRYLIYGADVVGMQVLKAATEGIESIGIAYRVGNQVLNVALTSPARVTKAAAPSYAIDAVYLQLRQTLGNPLPVTV